MRELVNVPEVNHVNRTRVRTAMTRPRTAITAGNVSGAETNLIAY